MTIAAATSEVIEEAAEMIRRGGLVAFPTETVYGLGADAANPLAVARIFEVKARPRIDPVIVHVADSSWIERYGIVPEPARRLIANFWPGPLTLVVPKTPLVPPIVTAGLETVAIRMPSHPAALALIKSAGGGIAAPSANPFGYVSPTTARHVEEQLGNKVDMILDGGACTVGVESTIVSFTGDSPCVLRAGGVPIEEIQSVLGTLKVSLDVRERPEVPGQMKRHYATRTRLEIRAPGDEAVRLGERVGLLTLFPPEHGERYAAMEILSHSGDLKEAAANLFSALRRLDTLPLDRIIARPLPEEGLGVAIMDRLRRCAA